MAKKTGIDGQLTFYDFCTDTRNYVAQANAIILGKQNLKLNSAKLIRSAIMQIKPDDEELKPYRVSINDLSKMFGVSASNLYACAEDIAKDITEHPIEVRLFDEKGKPIGFDVKPWVQDISYHKSLGMQIELNQGLKPLLLNLKEHYTQYVLDTILSMKSTNAIRLYELILSALPTKDIPLAGAKVKLSVQQIRECLGCEDKYTMFGHFHDRVIKPSVDEINGLLTVNITYDLIRYGRAVEDIVFNINTLHTEKRGTK